MATRLAKLIPTSMPFRCAVLAASLLWPLGTVALAGQTAGQAADPTAASDAVPQGVYVETVEVHWVLVPLVVRGPSGYIQELRQSDFQLTVDGRPVAIESFEAGRSAPVSLHLLQDLSGSMANADKLDMSWRILSFFLSSAEPGDEFAVTSFGSGRVEVQVPFTTDLWSVRRNKRDWQPYGVTALHDAVAWLPELTVGSGNAKRVAVLVTDGVDNASIIPPEEARQLVRQAELPVYVLGLGTGTPYALDPGGDKRYRYADVLNLLADQTGGRYASIDSPRRVRSVCGDIWQDLRHQYVLGFRADGGGEAKEHTIGVTVRGRKRTVIHRRGYHGGAPAAHSP